MLGEITSGAQDDLRRASDIVRRMAAEFGMSDTLGLVSLGLQNAAYANNPFVRQEWAHVSEETARKMDQECFKILQEEFENATQIVRANRKLFDQVVAKLLEKETIEMEDFAELVSTHSKDSYL